MLVMEKCMLRENEGLLGLRMLAYKSKMPSWPQKMHTKALKMHTKLVIGKKRVIGPARI